MRPDGDALGSMLALGHGLRALGKEVVFYDQDRAPSRLRFLPGAGEIRTSAPRPPERFDAAVVHDCGDKNLLGPSFPPPEVTGPLAVLDHHATVRDFGDVVYRDPSAAAVGILVARVLDRLGVPLEGAVAECLFCSLVSDTGWFRYASSDVEAFELGARLRRGGVDPWRFARLSEEEEPVGKLRLLALVLGTLELHGEAPRRFAFLHVDDTMLSRAGAGPELTEGFVNYARGIEGVEVGALLSVTRHGIRVSLRSKGGLDVGQVAARFGGGGHRPAAGCTLPGPLESAKRVLLAALEEQCRAG
jgi:phosphoesterase RecJ-like protein